MKKAVVVGALGVIGRNLVAHLLSLGDWEVVGLSRRSPDIPGAARFIPVDLLDRDAAEAALGGLDDVTHLFYCAYQPRPSWAELVAPNLAMLVNAVEPIEAASASLCHVHLVEGTKWYGTHLGPLRTPAREDDPPHMPPNFYYDQEAWLRRQQEGKRWSWSALRPQTVCGFALGSAMNLALVIAVYAAISKELGLPLRFPGKPSAWRSVYQATDADLLARAMTWAGTAPAAANEAFNVTNGDFFRWETLWPRFAEFFGMPWAPPQTIRLTEFLADKAPLWERIRARHGLAPYRFEDLAAWDFGDYVFWSDWDVMSDTSKIRRHGFVECVASDAMFLRLFGRFRELRAIPAG